MLILNLRSKAFSPLSRPINCQAVPWDRKELETRVLNSGTADIDHSPADDSLLSRAGMEASRATAPLLIEGEIRGVVTVAGKTDDRPYSADDLELLATICRKVAAALSIVGTEDPGSRTETDLLLSLRTLVQMRRDIIPTASPLALRLVGRTAAALNMSPSDIKALKYVLSLHDAGMTEVDEDIVFKVGALDDDERDVIGQHPMHGVRLMAPLLPTPEMREIIISHHEWLDGSGYPEGRRGEEIPLGARILAVIDAFFAMLMARPYRAGRPTPAVAAEIRAMTGTQFDPRVVEAFLSVLVTEGILDPTAAVDHNSEDGKGKRWQPLES